MLNYDRIVIIFYKIFLAQGLLGLFSQNKGWQGVQKKGYSMEWHWIYWVILAIAAFTIAGIERRQDRRHDELVEKINDLQDTIDRGFKIDREYQVFVRVKL